MCAVGTLQSPVVVRTHQGKLNPRLSLMLRAQNRDDPQRARAGGPQPSGNRQVFVAVTMEEGLWRGLGSPVVSS